MKGASPCSVTASVAFGLMLSLPGCASVPAPSPLTYECGHWSRPPAGESTFLILFHGLSGSPDEADLRRVTAAGGEVVRSLSVPSAVVRISAGAIPTLDVPRAVSLDDPDEPVWISAAIHVVDGAQDRVQGWIRDRGGRVDDVRGLTLTAEMPEDVLAGLVAMEDVTNVLRTTYCMEL